LHACQKKEEKKKKTKEPLIQEAEREGKEKNRLRIYVGMYSGSNIVRGNENENNRNSSKDGIDKKMRIIKSALRKLKREL
jgi:hypothetical protein